MPDITAIAADGTQHVFPDNTDPAIVDRVMKQYSQTAVNIAPSQYQSKAPSEAQQVATGLPGMPVPPSPVVNPDSIQHNPMATRAMQFGPGGPMFVDVDPKEKQGFEQAGRQGLVKGGEIGSSLLGGAATLGPAIEGGIAAAPAIGRTIVGGYLGGQAGASAGRHIGGWLGDPGLGAAAGGTIGSVIGGGLGAKGLPTSKGGLLKGILGGVESPEEAAEAGLKKTIVPKGFGPEPPPTGDINTTLVRPARKVNPIGPEPPPGIEAAPLSGNPPPSGPQNSPNQLTGSAKKPFEPLIFSSEEEAQAHDFRMQNIERQASSAGKYHAAQGSATKKTNLQQRIGAKAIISTAPAIGMVGAEFKKLGLYDLITPREQTTLDTMMNGPRWKDMDSQEKVDAVREILAR